jgi:hypothetical protein
MNGANTKQATFLHPQADIHISLVVDLAPPDWRRANWRHKDPLVHIFRLFSKLTGLYSEQILESLPERKWIILSDPQWGKLPVKVYKDKKRVLVEWLP